MLERIKYETSSLLATIEVRTQQEIEREEEERRQRLMRALQAQHAEAGSALVAAEEPARPAPPAHAATVGSERRTGIAGSAPPPPDLQGTFVRSERKVGRNEPCPCGSGKKYKHCHGALSSVE